MTEDLKSIALNLALLQKMFHDSPFGICIIDNHGKYLDTNPSFASLLGYASPDELINLEFKDVTHPEDVERDRVLTEKIFSGEIEEFKVEKRFLKKDGEVIWVKLYATTYEKTYGIGILESLDARGKYESQMAKLKKDLDQFIYKTSHDLRSPVANILGLTKLQDSDLDKDELIQMVYENAQKLDHIIREISDYSSNQKFPLKLEELDLDLAVNEAFHSAQEETRNKRPTELVKNIPFENVVADRARLLIILKNLIINAINFGRENAKIEICSSIKNSNLIIKIKDNGIGIRKDIQTKIYEMFYRGSKNSEGAGLGLFIVKEALQEVSGKISFSSQEGKGTEFIVEIPVP